MLKRSEASGRYEKTVFRLTPESKAELNKMAQSSRFCEAELMRAAIVLLEKTLFKNGAVDFNALVPLVAEGNGTPIEKEDR